jgi:hypothetical protein
MKQGKGDAIAASIFSISPKRRGEYFSGLCIEGNPTPDII